MSKKKYFVSDVYSHHSEHSLFVESFVEFFLNKDSTFLLNEYHIGFLDGHDVKANRFITNDSCVKRRLFRLFNREFCKTLYLLPFILVSTLQKRQLILLGTSNFQFLLLMFFFFFTRVPASIVLHGQVEAFFAKKTTLAQKFFLLGFKLSKFCNVKFLYLSHHIEKNILFSNNNFFCKHPIPQRIINELKAKESHPISKSYGKIQAASVGLIRNDKKNCSQIYNLKVEPNFCELWVVGRPHSDFFPNFKTNVKHKLWNSIYSDLDFLDAVKDISIFLYFFDKEQYKGTASATALDAVVHKKYAFCLPNEAIVSFLDGYPYLVVCNDLFDMSTKISELIIKNECTSEMNEFIDSFSLEKQECKLDGWIDN